MNLAHPADRRRVSTPRRSLPGWLAVLVISALPVALHAQPAPVFDGAPLSKQFQCEVDGRSTAITVNFSRPGVRIGATTFPVAVGRVRDAIQVSGSELLLAGSTDGRPELHVLRLGPGPTVSVASSTTMPWSVDALALDPASRALFAASQDTHRGMLATWQPGQALPAATGWQSILDADACPLLASRDAVISARFEADGRLVLGGPEPARTLWIASPGAMLWNVERVETEFGKSVRKADLRVDEPLTVGGPIRVTAAFDGVATLLADGEVVEPLGRVCANATATFRAPLRLGAEYTVRLERAGGTTVSEAVRAIRSEGFAVGSRGLRGLSIVLAPHECHLDRTDFGLVARLAAEDADATARAIALHTLVAIADLQDPVPRLAAGANTLLRAESIHVGAWAPGGHGVGDQRVMLPLRGLGATVGRVLWVQVVAVAEGGAGCAASPIVGALVLPSLPAHAAMTDLIEWANERSIASWREHVVPRADDAFAPLESTLADALRRAR